MANLPKVRRRKARRVEGRARQWARYKQTGNAGNLAWFRKHQRAIRFLNRVIVRTVRRRKFEQEFASKNFRYAEFNCRQGPGVPDYMHPHLDELCERVLEPLRSLYGPCRVTSGHRWDWYNASIGGASLSYHVYENRKSQPAADVIFAKGTPSQWAASARALGVGGVGQYDRSGFLHVDLGPRRDWWG